MILVAAYFEEREEYKNLLKIFRSSALKHMPYADIRIIEGDKINREKLDHHQDTFIGFKLAAEYALKLNKPCAVCDIDLMFKKSIKDVFEKDFDIAVTIRDLPARYNTGMWFYKPTHEAKVFLEQWIHYTGIFARNFEEIQDGIKKYAGIDQYSLACMIKKNHKAKILELPCQEWNAEQSSWKYINDKTRVVHLKSQLRNEIFGRPQNMKYDGIISNNIKIIPECKNIAEEARRYL